MEYTRIPDTYILTGSSLMNALFEQCKLLFAEQTQSHSEWTKSPEKNKIFQRVYSFITEEIYSGKPLTLRMIREAIHNYKDTLIAVGIGSYQDIIAESYANPTQDLVTDKNYILTNTGVDYYMFRDIVTNKNEFIETNDGTYRSSITDKQGIVRGLAELKPSELVKQEGYIEKQDIWYNMIESAINSLDELTADLFDLITYMWIVSPKTENGYIRFHSDQALALKKQSTNEPFKKRDRHAIMQRIGALTSLWVMMSKESIQILDESDLTKEKLEIESFHKMFDVGEVSIARDSNTQNVVGIYELEIKPSKILQPFLDGRKGALGVLDKKVFQYNHYSQREHKRLIRYLSYQWKIQSINRNYQPFKVSTLLTEMNISARYTGLKLKDRFDEILDGLQQDGIFEEWHYEESLSEPTSAKKKWIDEYWSKLKVMIEPLEIVKKENKKKIELKNLPYAEQEIAASELQSPIPDILVEENSNHRNEEKTTIELSPEVLQQAIKIQGITIKTAANDIGISYATLRRYLSGSSKKLSSASHEKTLQWMKETSSINAIVYV